MQKKSDLKCPAEGIVDKKNMDKNNIDSENSFF